jgi:hypothetical protein
MRQVLSLSLPAAQARAIKTTAQKRGFFSVSAYILNLFEADKDAITEKQLLKDVREAEREYQAGKAIKAGSITEALKIYEDR